MIPAADIEETSRVDEFHKLYYTSKRFGIESWGNTFWMGIPVLKCPLDLWLYQEILFMVKPDLVIECGTSHGGSALYLANIMDIIGHGEILSIDISDKEYGWARPMNPRIQYGIGNSVSDSVIDLVKTRAKGKKVMVILDSDHKREHVEKELSLYSPLVSRDSYIIVEDTNINSHPVGEDFGPGPMEAVYSFMKGNKEFAIDQNMGKFFLSFNPMGYLRRVA